VRRNAQISSCISLPWSQCHARHRHISHGHDPRNACGSSHGKLADLDSRAVTAQDVFEAATTYAAKELGRADLERLSPGAKADLRVVDLTRLHRGLTDDPIKPLVYMASQCDVESVFVDGREVVQEGRIPGLDERQLAQAANTLNQKQKGMFAAQHPVERREEKLFPPSYPLWEASETR